MNKPEYNGKECKIIRWLMSKKKKRGEEEKKRPHKVRQLASDDGKRHERGRYKVQLVHTPSVFLSIKPKNLYSLKSNIKEREYAENNFLFEFVCLEGIQKIGFRAFHNCRNLTKIWLAKSVRTIEHYAFCNCSRLLELEIGKGVEEIGFGFVQGTALKTLTMSLHKVRRFNVHALGSNGSSGPPKHIRTLRLRLPFSLPEIVHISLPRIHEKDSGQLIHLIEQHQSTFREPELLIADTIFYALFALKCAQTGLYNAYGSVVCARIFRFSFYGRRRPFPVKNAKSLRANRANIVKWSEERRRRGLEEAKEMEAYRERTRHSVCADESIPRPDEYFSPPCLMR